MSASIVNSLLAVLAGSVVGPIVTAMLKKLSVVDPGLGAAINLGATLVLYLGAWWLVADHDPAQLETYVGLALAAVGIGSAGVNVYRKKIAPRG